ncbi:MAG: hypothetical protein M1829_000333 [Trizodia sp. TS-e1964]|nr:MAG: hypothetical protein M1829_000333 [Trizodia sp. TS-e1964]
MAIHLSPNFAPGGSQNTGGMGNPFVIVWVCTGITLAILGSRLLLRKLKRHGFDLGDYLTMVTILFVTMRAIGAHIAFLYGNNNVSPDYRKSHTFTPDEIYRIETGSKFSFTNRVLFANILWIEKAVLLLFYKRLIRKIKWERVILRTYWSILALSYIVVLVVSLSECKPFERYWQVVPDPGTCAKATLQLFTYAAFNMFTDLLLIALPVRVLIQVKRPLLQKLQLGVLFSAGFFLIAITGIRLYENFDTGIAQVDRATWASAECLVASFVANTPVIYGLVY